MLSKYVDSVGLTSKISTDTPEPILQKKLLYRGDHRSPFAIHIQRCLRAFTSETTSQLHILGHDGDALAVDGAKVGI
jgi:hypothetical protein